MCNWSFLLLRVIQPLLNSCCGGRLGAPFNSCACNTISNGACYCVFAAQTNVVYQFASQIELSIISRAGWFGKSALGLHRCYCVDAASKINPRRTIDSLSLSLCYILFVFFSLRPPPPLSLSLLLLTKRCRSQKSTHRCTQDHSSLTFGHAFPWPKASWTRFSFADVFSFHRATKCTHTKKENETAVGLLAVLRYCNCRSLPKVKRRETVY